MAHAGFLRALGIAGWDALEPAVLATPRDLALADRFTFVLKAPRGQRAPLRTSPGGAMTAEALALSPAEEAR